MDVRVRLVTVCAACLCVSLVYSQNALAQNSEMTASAAWADKEFSEWSSKLRGSNYKPFVIGGEPASISDFPWQVAIVLSYDPDNTTAQVCGGSLIGEEWVITAAHCVVDARPAWINVLHGTDNLETGGERVEVASIYVHPQYSNFSIDYDYALIKLRTAVQAAAYVKLGEEDVPEGTDALVVGWGVSDETGTKPNQLLKGDQVSVSLDECRAKMSAAQPNIGVTQRMLCATYPTDYVSACYGDSGGPLLKSDAAGNFNIQIGVVSWGPLSDTGLCNNPVGIGVYSDVNKAKFWIESVMTADSEQDIRELAEHLTGFPLRHVAFNRSINQLRPFEGDAWKVVEAVLKFSNVDQADIQQAKVSTQLLKTGSSGNLTSYHVFFRVRTFVDASSGLEEYFALGARSDEDGYWSFAGAVDAINPLFIGEDQKLFNNRPLVTLFNGRPEFFATTGAEWIWIPYSAKAPKFHKTFAPR